MRKYCKAYQLKNLRLFPFWHEQHEAEEELVDDTIVYLWDDFTVVKNPVSDEQGVLWKSITPEWKAFCQETLHFDIPEILYLVYEQQDQEAIKNQS